MEKSWIICFIKRKQLYLLKDDGSVDKNKRHKKKVFTEKINKIALSSNDDKIMQLIDSIETFAYGTSKDLVRKNGAI